MTLDRLQTPAGAVAAAALCACALRCADDCKPVVRDIKAGLAPASPTPSTADSAIDGGADGDLDSDDTSVGDSATALSSESSSCFGDDDDVDGDVDARFASPFLPSLVLHLVKSVRFSDAEPVVVAAAPADEYERGDTEGGAPVRLRYAEMAEIMTLRGLMRRQHAMVPGVQGAVCPACGGEHSHLPQNVPSLEEMEARGL